MRFILRSGAFFFIAVACAAGCSSVPADSGTSGGAAVSTGDEGDSGAPAVTSAADAGASALSSVPGPLHFGGSLPLPAQPQFNGEGGGNHPDGYIFEVSNQSPYFGSDWAMTLTLAGSTGTTRITSLDVKSGALYSKTIVSGAPDFAPAKLVAPAANDISAQNAYRGYLDDMALILGNIVKGTPQSGAPGLPAAQPYLDYINFVRAQVGGPAFPPDGKTLPVSLINGGRLPIPSKSVYGYDYPVAPGGQFTLTIAPPYASGAWTITLDETFYPGIKIWIALDIEHGSFGESLAPGDGIPNAKPQFYSGLMPYAGVDTGFYHGLLASLDRRLTTLVHPAGNPNSGPPPVTELQPYLDYIKALEAKYPATSQTPNPIP